MALFLRNLRPWAPLLAALSLSAPVANGAAAASGGAPSERSSAKALVLAAQGLCFSASSDDDRAELAFLLAVDLDPSLFAARRGLAEQQLRRGIPRTAVRMLLEGARVTNRREDWRTAARAAADLAWSAPKEVGLDVAIADREALSEAVRGLDACPGEATAADEALLTAGFLRMADPDTAARHFRAHLAKLPDGATPSIPLFLLLSNAVCSPDRPCADRGPLAASLARALMAATPDWNRKAVCGALVASIPGDPGLTGLAMTLAAEAQRLDDDSSAPALAYAIASLGGESAPDSLDGILDLLRRTDPPNPETAFHLHLTSADFASRLDRPDESLRELELAGDVWREMRPGKPLPPRYAGTLAQTFWQTGDTNAAKRAYEAGLADRPGDPTLSNDLAYLLAESNEELDRALALVDASLRENPLSAASLDTLGWIFHRQGRETEALQTLRKAQELADSEDPEILLHVSAVLSALGRTDASPALPAGPGEEKADAPEENINDN